MISRLTLIRTLEKKEGFNNRKSVAKNLGFYQDFKDLIQSKQLSFSQSLSKPQLNFLKQLQETTYDDSEDSGFLEDKEQGRLRFINTESVQMMLKLYSCIQQFDDYVITILANLNRHIVLAVRNRLPIILEERGETTFSLQMVRLNQALTGKQGPTLARYIRHHYPVALIDESQDINGEQAMMIESIYLPTHKPKASDNEKSSRPKNPIMNFYYWWVTQSKPFMGFAAAMYLTITI